MILGLVGPGHPRALGSLRSTSSAWFFKWIFDSLRLHNEFVRQVVSSRRDTRVCEIGLVGYGRTWVLGLMPGSGLILSLLHASLSSRTRKLRHPASWLSTISLMLSFARLGCLTSVGLVNQLSPGFC